MTIVPHTVQIFCSFAILLPQCLQSLISSEMAEDLVFSNIVLKLLGSCPSSTGVILKVGPYFSLISCALLGEINLMREVILLPYQIHTFLLSGSTKIRALSEANNLEPVKYNLSLQLVIFLFIAFLH